MLPFFRIFVSLLCCAFLSLGGCATPSSAEEHSSAESTAQYDSDKLVDDVSPSTPSRSVLSLAKKGGEPSANVKQIRAPRSEAGARRALQRGLHAMQKEEFALAAAYFDAVLTTDLLTERGRMNLYWMAAESHQKVKSHEGEGRALESFLLLALVLDDDEPRIHQSTARLQALKVLKNPLLGRSRQKAIWVRDLREPASIMAAVSCGSSVKAAHLVDERIESFTVGRTRLLKRSARCGKGASVELWFDVSGAAPSAAP
ncbi:MAG: hypothetical protein GY822_15045 [Deltaproteobacteria bacterium]|nr:hypothetical protein [Deltaproteobacteria bacterium]